MNRFAVVVDGWNDLPIGQLMNSVAIVVGGLGSDGFDQKINGADGNFHSAIKFNMPILKAKKKTDFDKVINNAKQENLEFVVFCKEAQLMSNSFEEYKIKVQTDSFLSIISIAIYGEDERVRRSVKFLSAFA